MTAKTKDQIKAFFETGDAPTEAQFIDFIDSYVDKSGPVGQIETAASGMTTGPAFVSAGNGKIIGAAALRSFAGLTVYTTALAAAVAIEAVGSTFTTTAQASAAAAVAISSAYATTSQAVAGAAVGVVMDPVLTKNAIASLNPFGNKLLHIQDQKANGAQGGTFTNGAWRTRTLNTEITDEIGSTLSSNQFTLPSGTYFILARAPGRSVDAHKAKLANISDGTDVLIGSNSYSDSSVTTQTDSVISGRFTISSTKIFEIQHRCQTTVATHGFGIDNNFGINEIYTDVKIWKVA
jgi:hypothetical protein